METADAIAKDAGEEAASGPAESAAADSDEVAVADVEASPTETASDTEAQPATEADPAAGEAESESELSPSESADSEATTDEKEGSFATDTGEVETADDGPVEAGEEPDHAQDSAERVTVEVDVSARTAVDANARTDDDATARADDADLADASYAHAPTGAPPGLVADADDDLQEPGEPRNDFLWWLLTPIAVLLAAPLVVLGTTFLVALTNTGYPAICQNAAPDNMCEEVVLRMAAEHTVAFGIGWLLLWALPWRRSLRAYRIGLAVVIVAILLAAPLRLLESVDYQALMP